MVIDVVIDRALLLVVCVCSCRI